MATVCTAFINAKISATTSDVDREEIGEWFDMLLANSTLNVISKKTDYPKLNSGDSLTINLANYNISSFPNDFTMIIMKVIGDVEVQTTGKGYDNSTNITGFLRSYGVSTLPGILMIPTYNLTQITLVGRQNDTIVQSCILVCVPSDDSRLDS